MKTITTALLSILFAFASITQGQAANVLASSTISGTEIGTSGTYTYTLTLTALSGSAPIESFWFAWVPGKFFLQSTPTSITGDNGWGGAGDSGSIQFTGGTPITAGNTVTFTFQSTITPAQMTADVGSASSVAYPGAITFSGASPNETIGVKTVTPPAPPTDVLASSTILGTEVGTSGTYDYTLTLTALSNSAPIESFWFAWTPGNFFLQSQPTSITGDNGWGGVDNSGSIQFTGGTPITAGNTVTFTFQSTITPDQMAADVGTNSSVVYPGAITFSGTSPNETIGVQPLTPPAPPAPTNVLASSTISSMEIGTSGTYDYTLTLTALSNSAPIESFWFAWTPGNFFLQSQPTSITGDNGWGGVDNSGSIQFTGGTPITAGNTVTFTFQSTITPDQMAADVGTNSSVVYPGAITFSGTSPNETIGVQTLPNVLASSTILGTEIGTSGTYNYTLTLTALSNSAPIESFWFAWTPGNFFLQSTPTNITGDNSWTGVGDNGSIQFTGGTPITAGNTVTFTFVSTITPDQMTADVGTNSSVVYPGAITFSGTSPNETIGVQTLPPPAPTNVLASSAILGTEIGTSGTYNYTLTLTALSNSAPIESFWFAWTPGNFFLQSTPTNITGDNGWTGAGNNGSIQFNGGTPITAGNTVTFTFQSTITPDQMTADVGTNSSVVYPGAITFSGSSPNETIGVQTLAPPAQTNVLASSTISGTEIGATGTFNYTLTLTALSNSAPLKSFWFAWTPGNFFLQSTPTNITGNNGWSGVGDNGSIQFTGGTPITAGNTVTFIFQSTVTPAQMTADVGTNSSVVYPGAINFSGTSPNETIGVQTLTPPAPLMLGITTSSTALSLTWTSEVGKTYQLQSLADLTQTNWSPSGAPIVGTGSSVGVTNLSTAGQQMFYRIAVSAQP